MPTAQDSVTFLREFLRAPARIGAVAPSSRRLAAAATATIPERGHPVVVELGPGTGSFTEAIQSRLGTRGRHIAIELNPSLAELLARRHPVVEVVAGDAAHLPELLADRGVGRVDVVVSGLPWAAFPISAQHALLHAIGSVMDSGGSFTTFAYVLARWTPPGRRFRRLLAGSFEEVIVGRTVAANLPPACVYHARRPRI